MNTININLHLPTFAINMPLTWILWDRNHRTRYHLNRRQVCIAEVEEIVPVGALSPEESVRRSDLLGKRLVV